MAEDVAERIEQLAVFDGFLDGFEASCEDIKKRLYILLQDIEQAGLDEANYFAYGSYGKCPSYV